MYLISVTDIMSLFLGIGLATSTGFRVFLPLFMLSIIAYFTVDTIGISDDMLWIVNPNVMLFLGLATVLEVIAYFIPFLDNKLDKIKIPFAFVVGTILVKATFLESNLIIGWFVALVFGGGIAAFVSYSIAKARTIATIATKGAGNFIINTAELIGALCLSITAIFISPLAFIITVILLFFMIKGLNRLEKRTIETLDQSIV